jgi:hypothetical protein
MALAPQTGLSLAPQTREVTYLTSKMWQVVDEVYLTSHNRWVAGGCWQITNKKSVTLRQA